MSTPRYRSAPPSRSGSAISVSKATMPSSPGLKSFMGLLAVGSSAGRYLTGVPATPAYNPPPYGPSSDPDPRRRHRPGARRGDPAGARGDGGRVRLGRPARGHRRDGGERREPAARPRPRLDSAEWDRAEGADHDARRRRV